MPNVWYIGPGDVRIISNAEWVRSGAPGDTVTWGSANGWSVDEAEFTTQQLAILESLPEFLTGQLGNRDLPAPPLGLRPGDPSYGYWVATKQFRDEIVAIYEELLESGPVTPTELTAAINGLVGAAPGALDTLNELATALGNDPNFAATMTSLIGGKADAAATATALSGKEPTIAAGTTGQYYRGDKSWQTLNKSAVGLSSVDNTSDAGKPVSTAQLAAINARVSSSDYLGTQRAGQNQASDPEFTQSALWASPGTGYTHLPSTEQLYEGKSTLKFTKTADTTPGFGFTRSYVSGSQLYISVKTKDSFYVQASFLSHAANTGSNTIRLRMQLTDTTGVNATTYIYGLTVTANSSSFVTSRAWFTVPEGYDRAFIGVVMGSPSNINDVFYIGKPIIRDITNLPFIPIYPGITGPELAAIFSSRDEVMVQANPGIYTGCDGIITLKSNQKLIGNNATFKSDTLQFICYGNGGSGDLPHTGGSLLTSNQNAGSNQIQLNSGAGSSFAENDVFYIRAENIVATNPGGSGASESAVPTEIHQVQKVVGDVLHLTKALVHTYTVANSARLAKINVATGITIKDVIFQNLTLASTPREAVILLTQTVGSYVDIRSINGGQVILRDAIGGFARGHFETIKPWDTLDGTPLGYGINVTGQGHSTEVYVHGSWGARHLFTTVPGGASGVGTIGRTGPYSTVVHGSGFSGSQYEAHSVFDTHPYAYDTTFVGVVAKAGDNALSGSRRDNAAFGDRGIRTTFLNCQGEGFYVGIRSNHSSQGMSVIGGKFSSLNSEGAAVKIYGDGTVISGAYLLGPVGVLIAAVAGVAEPSAPVIKNCYFKTTVAAISDTSNGGAGDPLAIETGNTFDITSGVKFSGFIGSRDDSSIISDAISSGESTIARREIVSGSVTTTNSSLRLTYFTAKKTEVIGNVRTINGSTAAVGATLAKIGVYREESNGDLTLVASTANDTTLWTAASSSVTKAFLSSFTKYRGTRYAVAQIIVGSSATPTFYGISTSIGSENAVSPRLAGVVASQSDLPSTIASGSIGSAATSMYFSLVP